MLGGLQGTKHKASSLCSSDSWVNILGQEACYRLKPVSFSEILLSWCLEHISHFSVLLSPMLSFLELGQLPRWKHLCLWRRSCGTVVCGWEVCCAVLAIKCQCSTGVCCTVSSPGATATWSSTSHPFWWVQWGLLGVYDAEHDGGEPGSTQALQNHHWVLSGTVLAAHGVSGTSLFTGMCSGPGRHWQSVLICEFVFLIVPYAMAPPASVGTHGTHPSQLDFIKTAKKKSKKPILIHFFF